ncbi:OprD family porin [Pseudomonas sp. JM0905a]|uniref:OprD family porin n=1 Tax=Pseudomonas sp. JM0905a TaxID=2772484 RepID=UPI0016892D70|nr:OprD family porin [Pseudomonas sp. JM0905a]MBD2837790.1 OprD family porin [Pseudomonas sp. JM0905a]
MTRPHPSRALPRHAITVLALACSVHASADFAGDSKASLELRNVYINRDFRQEGAPQSKAAEWGQGFIARFESGFTDGTIGVGLDALGELGVKLDSSRDRRGTGLLPFGPTSKEPVDDYSELGLTAKLRASKSTLRLGTLMPTLPIAMYNDTRLLPSTFSGGMLTSQEFDGLTLNAGRLTETNLRDSSSRDDIGFAGQTSDHFDFAGGTWALDQSLALTAYTSELEDIYRQHFAGLVHTLPLGEGMSLKSDLRYFDSRDSGAGKAGRVDNRNFNGMFSLTAGAQRFSVAWQRLSGDSAFPFLTGGDPYVVNLVTFNTFTKPEEDSWQVRYDYDFASLGIPGLSFMTRYISGDGVEQGAVRDGREWERDTDVAYVVQSGSLRGFNIRLRNVTFRSGDGLTQDLDENRIILGYTLPLW